jgi:hypothetical protein
MTDEYKVKESSNYVDNEQFYQLMVERQQAVKEAEATGKPIPRINEKIGKIILDIATNLTYRNNFRKHIMINSMNRDDLVGDGVENCIRYLDRFDSDNYKNPFGYFTQICFYAFVRVITKDKKQWEIKKKAIEKHGVDWDAYARNDFDMDEEFFPVNPPNTDE